ncbi:MAG: site-specific DNA-methyltransferase [Deltaproteobacteria bacterium]|uniref:Site-specific DNA-methyltransferase n=1 Tax=Candidatus Zymogenus saltonus TaxID=2844893 RepID=A0A9D8KLV3_9DELT|nr:site-specific DNA-methyltransferase [Candidatus Zymogenus saltonus]
MFDSGRSEIENIIDDGLSAENLDEAKSALQELKRRQEPYLNWAGKAERTTFELPTVSLHVHERIDPHTIIDNVRKRNGNGQPQLSLFELPEENPPVRTAIEFYKHRHNWSNRLVASDSLLVMNSLLEKEGMAGKVQMIYIDPPYGIKYGSNFQPFVNKRDVRDGRDEDLTAEPEQIRAFRDTWELGIHSYLTYLRDRLLLSRELLNESGSVFIQISDENVHHVRELMDEVFGEGNFVVLICYRRLGVMIGSELKSSAHYLIFYAKDRNKYKFHKVFEEQIAGVGSGDHFTQIENINTQEIRPMTREERDKPNLIPSNWNPFQLVSLQTHGVASANKFPIEIKGRSYTPGVNKAWRTTETGIKNLIAQNRIQQAGNTIRYKQFLNDFPFTEVGSIWTNAARDPENYYVVQSPTNIIARCILMSTDPGDLVFDPTCGSGTTAFVAEKWGRRWITCDTSRIAITLAKQRLMTANYDYYEMAHPDQGVGSGFKYETVPHITLKSIANNEPPAQETLYDKPYRDTSKVRVTGPFTVEAVPAPTVRPLSEIEDTPVSDESISRSGETLRHAEWKDELLRTGIRGKNGQYIMFSRIETLPGTRYLHAEGETKPSDRGADHVREESAPYGGPQRVVISFGPEHAPLEQRQVEMAINEAQTLVPKPNIIVFASFQFDPEAAKDIDETKWPGVTLLKAQMNADLLTEDLKKKRASNDSFWLMGQPDVRVIKISEGEHSGKYRVEVHGFDYYNTKTGNVESGSKEKIALWMLDSDYDGRSLFPKQVFFPMAGKKDGWSRLKRTLRAEIDEDLIEAYHGTVSLPFEPGEHKKIAVKIVDDRGIESLKIIDIE